MSMIISPDQIEEGMILVAHVKNKHGQVLLRADTVLTPKHQQFLITWGVTSIAIAEPVQKKDNNISSNAKTVQEQQLEIRLGWYPQNMQERDLFDMAIQSTIEKAAGI